MPKQVDRDGRRRHIADAVFRLVAERGVEAVGLRDVAAEAGVSMGQVQHWFSTKQEMLLFTLGTMRDRVLTRLVRDLASLERPTVRDRVRAGMRVMLPLDVPSREEASVNVAFVAASFGTPEFADLLREGYARLRAAGRALLAEARERGELRDGVDADREADTIFFLTQGLVGPVLLGVVEPDEALRLLDARLDVVFRPVS